MYRVMRLRGYRLMGVWLYYINFTHHCKSQNKHTRDFSILQYITFLIHGVMGLRDYGVIVLRGYGVKALHFLGLIWLWGYRYDRCIEFSDFLKCFLRLGRYPDALESNEWHSSCRKEFFLWACVIIKGLIWNIKDYFPWKKLEIQRSNAFNQFYFYPNFFSYRFIPNFKKSRDSNEWRIIFRGRKFSAA